LVCAAADDVFHPNVRSGFFDYTFNSSVLDGVSPSSLMGDSGMSIFKFLGAIQLSYTTITTLLSTTHVSSPTFPPPELSSQTITFIQRQTCQQMQPLVVNESNQLTK